MPAQGRMLEAGMRIAALRLDERGAWEMDLDSGVTVRLGRRDVDERLDRFIRTASQVIAHRMNDINVRRHALLEWFCHRLAPSPKPRRRPRSAPTIQMPEGIIADHAQALR